MAVFSGEIGFVSGYTEDVVGVKTEYIVNRRYSGNIISERKHWSTNSDKVNPDLNIDHRISIVADPFAVQNKATMRYVVWDNVYWTITSIQIQSPRLILSIGGVYNGPKG